MAKKKTIHPADVNKRAKSIVEIATKTEETADSLAEAVKSAAAILGRKGGLKGGKARAAVLTPEQRSEIARKAAAARWGQKDEE
ncbi:hypothetical protein ACI6Q2_15600 [Chitinophagaceae bacterium LWZ2-11]